MIQHIDINIQQGLESTPDWCRFGCVEWLGWYTVGVDNNNWLIGGDYRVFRHAITLIALCFYLTRDNIL